ncbi:hypothetical protein HDU87_004305 [Geranomyces variabilis]|uniref:Enoyl reductase (ER) domain-containing protein n=1 Tax=Geranomyces variabilis TaxID=109894 RepID=A0AAD5XS37_9FUNG|nr:hypothetical protein HDU87_004305 [Geranomyces variabilis]
MPHSLVLTPATAPASGARYDDLKLTPTAVPQPSQNHSVIRLHAAALNHRDVFIRQGLYPRIVYNSVLGSDGAGVDVATGRKVLLNPSVNWATDPDAPEDPARYGMLGLLPFPGTFAEYISVPTRLVHPMPSHLSFVEAAALPLAGLTAWRATMSKGRVGKGDRVLVSGIGGGVALFALQFAVAAGAHVFVTSSDPDKIAKAIALGATGGVNYKDANWVKKLSALMGGQALDTVIDGAGGASIAGYLKLLRVGGRLVSYGATASSTASVLLPQVFLKHISLLGTSMGNETEFAQMIAFVEQHRIRPVVSTVCQGLDKAETVFEEMRRGSQFGKQVICIRADKQNGSKL